MTDLAQTLIEESEGRTKTVIKDILGYDTIGIGCCVDSRVRGCGLCDEAIDVQFAHDSKTAREEAADLPGFQRCNDIRQAVLVSVCFQLGDLHDWPHFKAALAIGDYTAAASAGLDSDWARTETSARAKREMAMLASGSWIEQT